MTSRLVPLAANVAQRVLASNERRKSFTLKNDSAAIIYWGHDSNVAVAGFNQGLILAAGGGNSIDWFHKGEVWAITAGNVNLTVIEDVE